MGEDMLTAKQEKFVQGIIEGMSQADAYRSAYPKQRMSDKTVWEAASRLMANSKVVARIEELRAELAIPTIMTAQKRLEWLTDLVNSVEESTTDKLKAIDIMNKMQGEYVQKVEANVNNDVTINIELSDDE
jgi:phage terminase small subunit